MSTTHLPALRAERDRLMAEYRRLSAAASEASDRAMEACEAAIKAQQAVTRAAESALDRVNGGELNANTFDWLARALDGVRS